MKTFIKIFIASSVVEFEHERYELGDFIRSLNDIYVERDIYIKLYICEDLEKSVNPEGKQEQYNQLIRESKYFYLMLGTDAGKFTLQEFEVAREQFLKTGAPYIYTYFKSLKENEKATDELKEFMNKLDKEMGHYYSYFSNLDTIKLNILVELARNIEINEQVSFVDGMVLVGENEILSLKNIPIYAKNRNLQFLNEEKQRLNKERAEIISGLGKQTDNTELFRQIEEIDEERSFVGTQIAEIEKRFGKDCNVA